MSEVTVITQTANQMTTNYDVSKFALGNNTFITASYTDSGSGSTLVQGTVMGRVASTGKVVVLNPSATDGSQYPVGAVVETKTVTASATVDLMLVNRGIVDSSKITFVGGDKAYSTQADKYTITAVLFGEAGNALKYTVAVDGTGTATAVKTGSTWAITLLSTAKTVDDLIALLADNADIRATLNGSATGSTAVTAVSSAASLAGGETFSVNTIVDYRRISDWLSDIGLELSAGSELTAYDNQ